MSATVHLFEATEGLTALACKSGWSSIFVTSVMNIRTKNWIHLFKCRNCRERTWIVGRERYAL